LSAPISPRAFGRLAASRFAVSPASARLSSTAPVNASTVEASAGTTTTMSVAEGATCTEVVPGAATTSTRWVPRGVSDSSLGSESDAPGTGSCISHQRIPATATIAAATPSQVFR